MYWQKRLELPSKDKEIESKILKIRKDNPNYGYRRITAILKRLGLTINCKCQYKNVHFWLNMNVQFTPC